MRSTGFTYCRRYFFETQSSGPRLVYVLSPIFFRDSIIRATPGIRTVVDIFLRLNHQGHAWYTYCRRYFFETQSSGPRLVYVLSPIFFRDSITRATPGIRTVVDIFSRLNHQGHAWYTYCRRYFFETQSPGPRLVYVLSSIFFRDSITRATPGIRTVVDIFSRLNHQGHAWYTYCRRYFFETQSPGPRLVYVLSSIFFRDSITRATPGIRTVVDIFSRLNHQGHAWYTYCRRYFFETQSSGPRLVYVLSSIFFRDSITRATPGIRTVVDIFSRLNHQGHAWYTYCRRYFFEPQSP